MLTESRTNGDPSGKLHGVLVTYRRPAELSTMLSRLSEQERQLDTLTVIDNDPSRQSEGLVHAYARQRHSVKYEPQAENLGPAGGFARGMERVLEIAEDRDWIVLLDDDNPPARPTVLGQMAEFGDSMLDGDHRPGAVGLMGARFDWKRARLVRVADHELVGPVRIDYIGSGQVPLYRAEAVRVVGPFRSEMFFGFPELEYGLRLAAAGYQLYAPGPVWLEYRQLYNRLDLHPRPGLGLSEPHWRRYYTLRNLIYILRSFGRTSPAIRVTITRGLGKPLANLPRSPRQAVRHLRLNWKACRDAWTGTMGRTIEPNAEAVAGDHV